MLQLASWAAGTFFDLALGALIGVGTLAGLLFFLGGGGANAISASARKSISCSRGMPTCPERASRSAKRVSFSSSVLSMMLSNSSSVPRCSFSSPISAARSSAKV